MLPAQRPAMEPLALLGLEALAAQLRPGGEPILVIQNVKDEVRPGGTVAGEIGRAVCPVVHLAQGMIAKHQAQLPGLEHIVLGRLAPD